MAKVYGPFTARFVDAYDADTLRFDIDLGFDMIIQAYGWAGEPHLSARIFGINAPEKNTKAGKEAITFAATLIKPGDICKLLSHGWDKYGGRFDATVTLPNGDDYAKTLVEAGHAVVFMAN